MIKLTSDKKRIILEIFVLLIVLVISGFFLYRVYYSEMTVNEALLNEYKLKEAEINKKFNQLNTEFFDNKKFKDLKDSQVEKIKIEDLEVGKDNPFENPKELEKENPQ